MHVLQIFETLFSLDIRTYNSIPLLSLSASENVKRIFM